MALKFKSLEGGGGGIHNNDAKLIDEASPQPKPNLGMNEKYSRRK